MLYALNHSKLNTTSRILCIKKIVAGERRVFGLNIAGASYRSHANVVRTREMRFLLLSNAQVPLYFLLFTVFSKHSISTCRMSSGVKLRGRFVSNAVSSLAFTRFSIGNRFFFFAAMIQTYWLVELIWRDDWWSPNCELKLNLHAPIYLLLYLHIVCTLCAVCVSGADGV